MHDFARNTVLYCLLAREVLNAPLYSNFDQLGCPNGISLAAAVSDTSTRKEFSTQNTIKHKAESHERPKIILGCGIFVVVKMLCIY